MRNPFIKKSGVGARFVVIALTIITVIAFILSDTFIKNPILSNGVIFIMSLYSLKSIIELLLLKHIVPSVLFREKQICIRLRKDKMPFLNTKMCHISLSCYIDGELIWKQKEKSMNLCFIPSSKTEKITKNIYHKIWIASIDAPFQIFGIKIFTARFSFDITK